MRLIIIQEETYDDEIRDAVLEANIEFVIDF
jgi:hypothetical protein